jgi:hypothetical protein
MEAACEVARAAERTARQMRDIRDGKGIIGAATCPKCGLEAKTLLHKFCAHAECPVRRLPPDGTNAVVERGPVRSTKAEGHTPGPWRLNNFGSRPQSINAINGAVPICSFNAHLYDQNRDQAQANARLIAAAPALLEALLEAEALRPRLLKDFGYVPEYVLEFCNKARAVLYRVKSTDGSGT